MKQIAVALIFSMNLCAFGAPEHLQNLREKIRQLVNTRHCVNCHTPNLPTAMPGALHVYDLSKANWFATMSDRQLNDFKRRMKDTLSPAELKETLGNSNEKPLLASQKKIVDDFVVEELAYRKSAPRDRFKEQQAEKYPEVLKLIDGK